MDSFIGIDVAKDRLDICVRPSGETFAVARDDEGLARLVERLLALAPVLVALEATGDTRRWSPARSPPRIRRSR
jgi:transposase